MLEKKKKNLKFKQFRSDPMSLVFPKVTKCTFYKSGPTGTIQVKIQGNQF